jgi:hypothetical protein
MPLTVQVLPEALRSRMVYQMVPAAPSVPWTDPSSAEAAQRPGPGGVVGPGAGCGLVVGTGDGGWVVSGGWGAEDGAVEVEWALQPVTAMAAATATAAMILAGRTVVPPDRARRCVDRWQQRGLGWSRADGGQASRPVRNDLDPVAIVTRNALQRVTRARRANTTRLSR